jgi:hypothetical protein
MVERPPAHNFFSHDIDVSRGNRFNGSAASIGACASVGYISGNCQNRRFVEDEGLPYGIVQKFTSLARPFPGSAHDKHCTSLYRNPGVPLQATPTFGNVWHAFLGWIESIIAAQKREGRPNRPVCYTQRCVESAIPHTHTLIPHP